MQGTRSPFGGGNSSPPVHFGVGASQAAKASEQAQQQKTQPRQPQPQQQQPFGKKHTAAPPLGGETFGADAGPPTDSDEVARRQARMSRFGPGVVVFFFFFVSVCAVLCVWATRV